MGVFYPENIWFHIICNIQQHARSLDVDYRNKNLEIMYNIQQHAQSLDIGTIIWKSVPAVPEIVFRSPKRVFPYQSRPSDEWASLTTWQITALSA